MHIKKQRSKPRETKRECNISNLPWRGYNNLS